MSVRELRHDRPSGRFSKSRGLSASVFFLSSPPPPRSFACAICGAVSLTLVPRSLLLNRTETLATQAIPNTNLCNFMCPLVDFGKVLCSSAKELQQNSNPSSREDYIQQQILTFLSEILHIYI